MISITFLAAGLILIFLEFYLPGGILGILGALVLLGSVFVFYYEYNSPLMTIVYIAALAVFLGCVIKYALWAIPKAPPSRSVYLQGDQEGYVASTYDKSAIGKIGTVVSDLKPGGHILIEGKKHQAISISGYIAKGEQIIVVGGEGESLTVKKYHTK